MVDSERYHKALRKCFLRSYGSQAIVIPEPQKTVFETEVKKNNSTFAGLMGFGVTGMYFLRTRVLRKQLSNAEAASFLQSIEEGTERQRSHASSVSESSGEARMRKVIQAASLTYI